MSDDRGWLDRLAHDILSAVDAKGNLPYDDGWSTGLRDGRTLVAHSRITVGGTGGDGTEVRLSVYRQSRDGFSYCFIPPVAWRHEGMRLVLLRMQLDALLGQAGS